MTKVPDYRGHLAVTGLGSLWITGVVALARGADPDHSDGADRSTRPARPGTRRQPSAARAPHGAVRARTGWRSARLTWRPGAARPGGTTSWLPRRRGERAERHQPHRDLRASLQLQRHPAERVVLPGERPGVTQPAGAAQTFVLEPLCTPARRRPCTSRATSGAPGPGAPPDLAHPAGPARADRKPATAAARCPPGSAGAGMRRSRAGVLITSRRSGRCSQQELAQPAGRGRVSQPGSQLDGERSHFGLGVPCVRGEEEFPGRGTHGPRPVPDGD